MMKEVSQAQRTHGKSPREFSLDTLIKLPLVTCRPKMKQTSSGGSSSRIKGPLRAQERRQVGDIHLCDSQLGTDMFLQSVLTGLTSVDQ